MSEELLYTQEDIDEWVKTCEELQDKIKEQEETIEQLSEYKRLEEQDLIVKLPCKVGDDFYGIERNNIFKYRCLSIKVMLNNKINLVTTYNMEYEFGVDAFLTRSEAEKKLKELKGEE